jgi:hypothetical protein
MRTPWYSLVVSPSGGGKSLFVTNLLKRFSNTFEHIYIVNQESEPLYDFLLEKIPDGLTITHKISDLPSMEELGKDKEHQKLFIFDDMVLNKNQDYIKTLYMRGRKLACSVCYLTQSNYSVDSFIRKNLHYLILLSIAGMRDLTTILANYKLGVDENQLLEIYKIATAQHLDFLKIDVRTRDMNKKFSRNFNQFFHIEDEKDEEVSY